MPTQEELDACREEVEFHLETDLRSGLDDEARILFVVADVIGDQLGEEAPPELLQEFTAQVRKELAAYAEREKSWTTPTMNDRIDAAFADLNARGILAEQALGSTVQEGGWLSDEKFAEQGSKARGNAYHHRQDLQRGVNGEGLLLAFTGYQTPPNGEEIGREIVHVLQHHGVPAEWSGSVKSRIEIAPFPWQKRRTTKAPPSKVSTAPALPPLPPPPPPPAICALCKGRGWVISEKSGNAEMCSCKR